MPRLVRAIPKYRRHKASGQAIVTIAGRDCYLGPFGSKASKLEYNRLIGEWVAAGRPTTTASLVPALSISELILRYWDHACGHYRRNGQPTSELATIRAALKAVRKLYSTKPAHEFGPLALKAVRDAWIAQGLARTTVNKNAGRVRRMFRWAVSEELVPASVFQALQSVTGLQKGRTNAKETSAVKPITDDQVELTLAHMPEIVRHMVQLQRLLGCRPAELCTLRPADINRDLPIWEYRPLEHKTGYRGRDRVILIGPRAQQLLARYFERPPTSYCFDPRESEQRRRASQHERRVTPLTSGNRPGKNRKRKPLVSAGDRYNVGSYRRAIHRACDKAGIPRWSPNRLRHAAATEIRRRFGLEASQVVLGHANADVTQVYADRDLELAKRVAQEMG